MTTLRSRLLLAYSLTVAGTVAALLLLGLVVVERQLLHGTDFLLEAEFREVEPRLATNVPPSPALISESLIRHVTIDAAFYYFQVHDQSGRVLFRSPNLGETVLPDLTPARRKFLSADVNGLGLLRIGEFYTRNTHIQIATSLNYLVRLKHRFYTNFAVGLPIVLLLSAAVGWALCEIFLRPLRLIEAAARRISLSNLQERIPVGRTRDEIAKLSELLNAMFDRLEKSFEQIKQFTADLSHELRTPLSIVSLHAERLLKKSDLDSESAMHLSEVLVETKRLNQIIDQLLVLAKAEAQALPLTVATRSAAQFIGDFAEDAAALAEAAGKRFALTQNENLSVRFDQSWMRQVLFNLLSNAIKFSPPGGLIQLGSTLQTSFWVLSLSDEGPGIPPDQSEHVFERFKQFRVSSAHPEGTGLGLAVCKSIVELHGGTILARPGAGGKGLCIEIRLPC